MCQPNSSCVSSKWPWDKGKEECYNLQFVWESRSPVIYCGDSDELLNHCKESVATDSFLGVQPRGQSPHLLFYTGSHYPHTIETDCPLVPTSTDSVARREGEGSSNILRCDTHFHKVNQWIFWK